VSAKQLEGLVRLWQGRLGLEAWRLHIEVADLDEATYYASTAPAKTGDEARLIFAPWVLGRGQRPTNVLPAFEGEIEATIVHELLHLVLRDLDWAIEMLEGQLHRDLDSVFKTSLNQTTERTIDRLAWALVRSWPRAT